MEVLSHFGYMITCWIDHLYICELVSVIATTMSLGCVCEVASSITFAYCGLLDEITVRCTLVQQIRD